MYGLKVTYLESIGQHGGMELYDDGLCSALANLGVRVTWVTCDETRHQSDRYGFSTPFSGIYGSAPAWKRGLNYMSGLIRVWNRLRAEQSRGTTAILHMHFFPLPAMDALFLKASRRIGARIVVTAHDVTPLAGGPIGRWAMTYVYRTADHIIVHADFALRRLKDQFSMPADKISVIGLGNFVRQSREEVGQVVARSRLGLPQDIPIVLFFGSVRPGKGLEYLIQAMPRVTERFPNAVLAVVGRPQKQGFERFQTLIQEYELTRHVYLRLEYVPDNEVPLFFRSADVVAIPYVEIFQSAVLLMAFSNARPVVATAVGGIPEIVREARNGYLVPPRDSMKLAEAIIRVISDPASAARMGREGYELVQREYAWNSLAQQTLEVYRRVLTR